MRDDFNSMNRSIGCTSVVVMLVNGIILIGVIAAIAIAVEWILTGTLLT